MLMNAGHCTEYWKCVVTFSLFSSTLKTSTKIWFNFENKKKNLKIWKIKKLN